MQAAIAIETDPRGLRKIAQKSYRKGGSTMAEGQPNGWHEWGKHVLKELERQELCDGDQWREIRAIQIDIATIKAKAFGWGSIGGIITGVIASIVAHALTK